MAQETSGLRTDDERPEVHSDLDRDNDLALSTTTSVNAEDDTDLSLADDEVNDDTEQLRHEIEETRSSMGETIDAIQERLSIANISEQVSEQVSNAIETAKDSAYDATIGKVANFMKQTGNSITSSSFGRSISANPWPYALIGLGSAWLIYSNMGSDKRRYSGNGGMRYGKRNYLGSQGNRETGQAGGMRTGSGEGVSGAYDSVASTASGAMDTVSTTASQTYNKATDVANRAFDRVGEYGHVAQEKYEEYIEKKPLAMAAAAAAVGAAIGLAIPSTRYEGQLVGETRDNLMSKAGDTANQLIDKAKEVAGEAGKTIKEEINAASENAGTTGSATRSGTGPTGGGL